uniref:Eph LBD domain-containing protein n=1 Tax=Parascaris equorum TaxID=6256 RepID=A0A914RPA7_PAREQ
MRDCNEFPGNARSCKETFRLYAMQVSGTEVSNTWNETSCYTVTKDAAYFAFRDSGACISILNVKVKLLLFFRSPR